MEYPFAWILTYSGTIAAITASWMILFPPLFIQLNHSSEPISNVVHLRVWRGRLFNLGLMVTAVLLSTYMFGLVIRFNLQILPLGAILYIIAHIFTFIVGLVPIHKNRKIHSLCTKGYFLLMLIGSLLFGFAINDIWSTAIIFFTAVVTILLYSKFGMKALTEYCGITGAIIWGLHFYFV